MSFLLDCGVTWIDWELSLLNVISDCFFSFSVVLSVFCFPTSNLVNFLNFFFFSVFVSFLFLYFL